MGRIGVAPVFSKQAEFVAQNASAFGITFDAVRLVVRGSPDTTVVVKDTTITFTPSSGDVTLDIPVPVVVDAQKFNVGIDYTSQTSGVIFHGSVVVTSYRPGRAVPPQQEMAINYVGPGATVASLTISPDTTAVVGNASASLTVTAFDDKGGSVAAPPLLWSTSDASIAAVVGTGAKVAAQGQNRRGKAFISVISPSGAADTSAITVGLPAASIVVVSGAGQTGAVHAALAAPAVVQVNAVDGIGVPGVTVVFGAPDGGAVGAASATTDANGRASTTMTLGTVAGAQAFAASAAGFSAPIAATATPGGASAVAIVAGNSQSDTIQKALAPLSVRVADEFANVVPNAVVSWTRVRGTGTLGAATTTTGATGIATNSYTLGTAAGSDSIAVAVANGPSTGFSFTTKPGNPAAIAVVSGTAQTAFAGTALAPFIARVTDASGNPIAGVVVTWSVTNGTIGASTTTGADGQTSNTMTVGSTVGPASAVASIAPNKTVTFTATTTAGTGTQLVFTAQPSGVANNVTLPAVVVAIRDAFGNQSVASTLVTLTLGNAAGATLSGTLTRTSVNGVATFDDLKIDRAGIGFTLVASSGALPNATSTTFAITASGTPQVLLVPSSPTTFTKQAGSTVANPPSVKIVNGSGLPIAGAPVRFVTKFGATTVADVTLTADANGTLSAANALTPDIAGVYTVTATSTAAPSSLATATLTVTPGAPAALGFVAPTGTTSYSAQTGAAITPAVSVAMKDAFGNAVTSATNAVSVSLSNPNGATLSGTTSAAAVNGVATFSNLSINAAGNGYVLSATSGTLTAATSLPVNILAPGSLQLAFGAAMPNATAGAAVTPAITVQVRDAQNQLAATSSAPVTLTILTGPSGATIAGGAAVAAVNGVATFSNVIFTKAGTYSLSATSAGITPATSTTFTVVAGPGVALTKSAGDGLSAVVGTATATAPKVLVTDASGNAVSGATVTYSVLTGAGTINPVNGVVTSDANGFAALSSWTLGAAVGSNTVEARLNAGTAQTFTATGTSSAASAIAIVSGSGQSGAIGSALAQPFVVKVTDSHGNAVSGATVTWAGTNGSFAPTTTSTIADGTASNVMTLGSTLGAASATATIVGVQPVSFTATAGVGPASKLVVATQPANTASGATMSAVSFALRDQGGNATSATNAVTIAIAANPSAGVLGGTLTRNAVNGVVTFDNLSIDKAGNGYTLTATSTGLTPATTSAFNVTGGAAAHVTIAAGDNGSAVVNGATAIPPKVKVTDAAGNAVSGASVTFAVTAGGGSLNPANGLATSDANGFASLNAWVLGPVVGTNTLDAHLTANPAIAATFTAHSSNSAAATIQVVSGGGQSGTVNTALGAPLIVKVFDATNNPVVGATVAWTTTNGTTAANTITAADGTSSTPFTLGTVAGAASATATIPNLQNVSFAATAIAGAPARLAVTAQPANTTSGATMSGITFAVRDQFGNATNGTNAVTVAIGTNPSGGTLSGTLTRNAGAGLVTFNDLSINKAGAGYTLTASASGLTGITTGPFSVGAGAATQLVIIEGNNVTGVVGQATSPAPKVQVTDAAGNAVSGATVTYSVLTGNGTTTPAGGVVVSDASGFATLGAWVLGPSLGANTIEARLSPTVAATFSANASSSAASAIAIVSGDAQTATVGAVLTPFVVKVTDATNNPVSGATVTWTASNGSVAATTTTAADGTTSNTMTLGHAAGAASATASIAGHSVPFSATANAGTATQLVYTTQPVNATSAATMAPVVLALRDQFNNATTATNWVTIAVGTNPAAGILGGTMTRNAVNGVVTFDNLTIDKAGVGYTLIATSGGLTAATSTAFNVVAGAAAHIAISAGDNQSAVVGTATPIAPAVKVTDASGNVVSGASVTFTVASGGGSVVGSPATSNAGGIATLTSWIVGPSSGPNTLTAAIPGASVTFTASASSSTPATIAIVSGNGQSATVATALASPLVVRVLDAGSNPVAGAVVAWTSINGTVTAHTTTLADGTTSNTFTLGTLAGSASANASLPNSANVSFSATATAGAPAGLAITTQPTTATAAATMTNVVAGLRDQYGNVTTGTNAVTIAIGTNPSAGTLSGTVTRNAVNGVVTFDDLSIQKSGVGYTLVLSGGGLTSATSAAFNVVAGAAANVAIFAGDNQSAVVGTATPIAPAVKVTDASGNAVSGASVTFTVASGGGSVVGSPATSNASGIATLTSWIVGPAIGSNTLEARLNASAAVTFTANASSAAVSAIAIVTGDAQSATVGQSLGAPFIVHVTDAGGNPVTGALVTWTAAGGTLSATSTTTAADGNASSAMTLGTVAGSVSATATVAGQHVTFTGTAVPAAAVQTVFVAQPANTTAGATMSAVSVAIRDSYGNTVNTTSAVTLAIGTNPSTGTLGGTLTRNAVNGVATFTDLSIDHNGVGYTLVASSLGLTTATSNAFTITVGAPAHITVVAGDNLSAVVGQPTGTAPQVRITDASGNVVPSANVTFSILSGNGSIKLTSGSTPATTGSIATNASGLATIDSWTLGPAIGTNTLEARVSLSLAVTFTASASSSAANAIAVVSGGGQSGTVATALAAPFVVKVMDVNNNPVTGASVSWTASNGTIAATSFTASDGTTSATMTLGNTAGAASATATIGNGQHVSFAATALPGAAASLSFTSQPPNTTANVTFPAITLMLRDAFGNATPATTAVTLSLGTNPTNANLTGTVTRSAVNGVVTFDDVAVDGAGAGYRLLAAATGLTSATSNAFNVASDVVSSITITSGNGQTGTVNNAAAAPFVVTVADAGGSVITAATISWSARHGTQLSATETSSGTDGRTSISIIYSTLAGGDTITATSLNGRTASFVVTAVPGAPVKLGFIVPPGTNNYSGNTSAPIAIPVNLQAAIEDVFGNVVTTSTAPVSLTLNNPNGGALANAPTTNAVLGVATWDQARINKVGIYTVTATSNGLTSATSLPISISFGSVTGVEFVTKTGTGTANNVVTPGIQLRVTDTNGDLVTTPVSVTLTITFANPAGGTLTGTTTLNTTNGLVTFSDLVFSQAATYRLKADASAAGFGTATSGNFVISP